MVYMTQLTTKSFKALLASWMSSNGLTQQEAAAFLGVTQPTISYWLKGTSQPHAITRSALISKMQTHPQKEMAAA